MAPTDEQSERQPTDRWNGPELTTAGLALHKFTHPRWTKLHTDFDLSASRRDSMKRVAACAYLEEADIRAALAYAARRVNEGESPLER
jgi:hypothetical protein